MANLVAVLASVGVGTQHGLFLKSGPRLEALAEAPRDYGYAARQTEELRDLAR